jgi:hypothetical protein
MKILYQKKVIEHILQENPIVFITNSQKENFILNKQIKNKKFKNLVLQQYNKNLFNGIVYFLYGHNILKEILDLKILVSGVFYQNKNFKCIISFKKFLILNIYYNSIKIKPLLNILEGNLFWFILKISKK